MRTLINFRDMGGRKSQNGGVVRYKRLLRSGELVGLTDQDKAELTGYNLKHIVDLRSEYETQIAPDTEINGAEYHNILLHKSRDRPSVSPEEKEFRKLKEESLVIDFMTNVYVNLITGSVALDGFSRFVKIVNDNKSGSVLFHCFAGKDRTGVAAAILYTLLGVSEDDILSEYMMTNALRKERNDEIISKERQSGKTEEHLAALRVSYEVREVYLNKIFEIAKEKSGSFLEYIKQHMGINDNLINQLRENYLE